MNKVILCGSITSVAKGTVTMETTEPSGTGDVYTEVHNITCKPGIMKDVKTGKKFKMVGSLGRNDENRTQLQADSFKKLDKSQPDANMARLTGIAHRSFEFYPRAEGRMAFGNLLVSVDDIIFRGVAFGHTAHMLHRGCKRGSTVQLEGRVRAREYQDNQGDDQIMIEVVADPDYTKVLKKAVIVDDRFADLEEDQAKAI
jgi:hypothetical protein